MIHLIVLAALVAAALSAVPAVAQADARTGAVRSAPTCTVQQVHTPAGKLVHQAPITWCTSDPVVARNDVAGVTRGEARAARD